MTKGITYRTFSLLLNRHREATGRGDLVLEVSEIAALRLAMTKVRKSYYNWMKRYPERTYFLVNKLQQSITSLGLPPVNHLPSWQERWNEAQMQNYAKPQSQKERLKNQQKRPATIFEKPLRD